MHKFYLARRFALLYPDGPAADAPAGGAPAVAPAVDGAGPGGAAVAGGAPTNSDISPVDWRESIADAELKQYVEERGFKEPADVLKAMREAEAKSAAPSKPEEYELGDGDFAKTASTWFHKHGIPADKAKGLAAEWNAFVEQQNTAADEARKQAGEAQMTALKTEWGDGYDRNLELGRQAMRKFGLSGEFIDRMAGQAGDAETIKVFSRIGAALSEGTLNPGGGPGSAGATLSDEERAARFFSGSK